MAIFNPHGLLPIPVRKESKVSTPLARLTHSPCTDAFAPGKPHLQLPRLAGPAATNLLIQGTKEEHGRTPNSKLQCVLAPVRLETTVGASTIAASWHQFVRVFNAKSSSRKNMVNFLVVKQAQCPERKEGIRFAAACYKPNSSARDGRPRDHVSQC